MHVVSMQYKCLNHKVDNNRTGATETPDSTTSARTGATEAPDSTTSAQTMFIHGITLETDTIELFGLDLFLMICLLLITLWGSEGFGK